MEAATAEGLRERKKRRTRATIVERAEALFAAKGFEATTVADIAAAADIAPRTFFAYFPTKEDVVFWEFDEAISSMRERFSSRPDDEGAIDAMRSWIGAMVCDADFDDERKRAQRELIRESESLRNHDLALRARFQEALAEALRDDFSGPAGDMRAEMVAAAATAAMAALTEDPQWAEGVYGPDPMAVIDEVLTFVRGGIAAISA